MKKIFYLIGVSLIMIACGSTQEEQEEARETDSLANIEDDGDLLASTTMDPRTFGGEKHQDQLFIDNKLPETDNTPDQILGCYVGEFGKNMINITLFKVEDGHAEGYSVCAGNFRKIEGTVDLMQDDEYIFEMDEPGDDQYDGHFSFTLDASEQTLKGSWEPFKEEGNSSKNYKLEKREYHYNPNAGSWPEVSTEELDESFFMNYNTDELATMRNEIYARHGYSFKNKEWRYYFEGKDWYMPMGIDIRDKLTDIEVANIEMIYDIENYYEDYYDEYGR